jgi:hypothetical protein
VSKRGTPERTKKALQEAIAAIDQALATSSIYPEAGPNGELPSRDELLMFRTNLQRMLEDVLAKEEHPMAKRSPVPPLGRIIADYWALDFSLGEVILGAEHEYQAFTKREGYLEF